MLPHHRRRRADSAGSEQFSFFSPSSDDLEYNTWAENLKTLNNPFGKRNPNPQFGPWARAIRSASHESSSSPPLWKAASPESRPNSSRAQLIDRYRREMMDLVRDLPETAYELSLKDMVELRPIRRKEEEEEEEAALGERWEARKGRGKRRGSRNGSMDAGGFLLKLFTPSVPAAIRGGGSGGGGRKISPRPMAAACDGEWSSGGFRDRSSSNGSSGSSCSGGGRQRWKFGGCYSFFYRHRRSRSN